MIEYLYTEGKIGDRNTPIPVKLNGKHHEFLTQIN